MLLNSVYVAAIVIAAAIFFLAAASGKIVTNLQTKF